MNSNQHKHTSRTMRMKYALGTLLVIAFTASAMSQGTLTNGGNHDGSITVNEQDGWTFDASEGDRLFFGVGQVSGGNSFAPRVRVFDPVGLMVGYGAGASSSTTSEARFEFVASSSGSYTVTVDSLLAGGTGTYRLYYLNIEQEFIIPGGDQGGELTSGSPRDGSTSLGDFDVWTFQAATGDRITLNLRQLSGGTSFSPKLQIFNGAGDVVGYSYDSTSTSTSETELVSIVSEGGDFVVVVESGLAEGTGTYRLSYTLEEGPFSYPVATGTPLSNGALHEGSISVPFEMDDLIFEAEAGDAITVRLGETDNGSGFHPLLRLRGPDGTLLDGDNAPADAWVETVAEVAGTYTVQVADFDTNSGSPGIDDTGSYRLELIRVPGEFVVSAGDEGGPMTNGALHEGSIHVGDIDTWTFEAEAGDVITVRLGETDNGSGFHPLLRLRGPDGTLLDTDNARADAWVETVAEITGTYTVQVADFDTSAGSSENDDTGSYRLELSKVPGGFVVSAGDEGGPMTAGVLHEGTIHVGDIDTWTFEADIGNAITLQMEELSGNSFSPSLRVYGPTGQLLASRSHSSLAQISFVAPDSGIFVVVAMSESEGGDGAYRLTNTGLPEQGKQLRYAVLEPDTLTINWPSALAGYVLQQSVTVADPDSWEDVGLVDDNGLNVRITVPIEVDQLFFRLRPPGE